jgi:hypothetical protein
VIKTEKIKQQKGDADDSSRRITERDNRKKTRQTLQIDKYDDNFVACDIIVVLSQQHFSFHYGENCEHLLHKLCS